MNDYLLLNKVIILFDMFYIILVEHMRMLCQVYGPSLPKHIRKACVLMTVGCTGSVRCMVPQIINLRLNLLKTIVHVIRFIIKNYTGSTVSIVYTRSNCHLTIYPNIWD